MAEDLLSRTLQRCMVESIAFPIEAPEQEGGRGVPEHEQWGRDGSDLGDSGRKAYRGSITGQFIEGLTDWPGSLFPDDFFALLALFAERRADLRLAHPLLGTFAVKVPRWKPRLVTGVRNGGYVDFDWIEQGASLAGVVSPDLPPVDVGEDLAAKAAAADRAMAGLGVLTTIARAAEAVRSAIGRALAPVGEVKGAISQMRGQLTEATRLVSLQPLTGPLRGLVHAARASVAQCKGALARVEEQATAPTGLPKTIAAPRAMTTGELAAWVYQDARRARDLRAANGLASDRLVQGQELIVP